jgi:branched-subunit amino acid transport protein
MTYTIGTFVYWTVGNGGLLNIVPRYLAAMAWLRFGQRRFISILVHKFMTFLCYGAIQGMWMPGVVSGNGRISPAWFGNCRDLARP